MREESSLKAVVVGLGRIGQLYDLGKKALIATHARAYAKHAGYQLLAGVDPDPAKRRIFEKTYHKPAYTGLKDLPAGTQPDVISICLPTPKHARAVQNALDFSPRAILCEKPIASTLAEARKILVLCRKKHCLLVVNYMRRFEPAVQGIRALIRSGKLGDVIKGVVWYGNGILNNGSHYINLLEYWLGGVREIQILKKGPVKIDPEPDLRIRFGKTDVYFLAFDPQCYTALHLELLTAKGKIAYLNRGAETYFQVKAGDKVFPGYEILGDRKHPLKNDYDNYQWHVVEHLRRVLHRREKNLRSDGASALATLKVVHAIRGKLERV